MADKALEQRSQVSDRCSLRVLRGKNIPVDIAEIIQFYDDLAQKIQGQRLRYLALPPVLAPLESDPVYQRALCWGRGFYVDGLHVVDDAGQVLRVPDPYDRTEIREVITMHLALTDPRATTCIALAWRVGVVVGWLSGLAISQREDAQAGMVVLAALVSPLMATPGVQRLGSVKQVGAGSSRQVKKQRVRSAHK